MCKWDFNALSLWNIRGDKIDYPLARMLYAPTDSVFMYIKDSFTEKFILCIRLEIRILCILILSLSVWDFSHKY